MRKTRCSVLLRGALPAAALLAAGWVGVAGCGDGPSSREPASPEPTPSPEPTGPTEVPTPEPSEPEVAATQTPSGGAAETEQAPESPEATEKATATEPPEEPGPQLPSPAAIPPKVQEAISTASQLRAQGRPADAAASARAAEKSLGNHGALRLELARAYMAQAEAAFREGLDKFMVKGYVADAHLRLDQAVELDPHVAGAAVLLGRILRYEENPVKARRVLEAYVVDHPNDVGARRELGDMAYATEDWVQVDLHYTKVFSLDPTDGVARLRSTLAQHYLGQELDVLVAGYTDAARLLPEVEEPVRRLTTLRPGDKTKTAPFLEKVVEDNPDAVLARIWLSWIERTWGDPDLAAATRLVEKAVAVAPEHVGANVNLAEVRLEAGDVAGAVESYTTAISAADPGSMEPASNVLDQLLFGRKTATLALDVRVRAYDAVVKANPTVGRFGNNAGFWFREAGSRAARKAKSAKAGLPLWEHSVRYYLAATEAVPDDQDYLNDTGLMFLFHLPDRRHECLPLFEQVLEVVHEEGGEPMRGYWDSLENLCKYWFEEGDYGKVLKYADLRNDPRAYAPPFKALAWKAKAKKKIEKEGIR